MLGYRGIRIPVLLLYSRAVLAFTQSLRLDQTWANHQQCIDMSGTRVFEPGLESSLSISFEPGYSGIVSVVIFELGDEHLGGIRRPGTNEVGILCSPSELVTWRSTPR